MKTKRPNAFTVKDELLVYLRFCRKNCHDLISNLTEDGFNARWINHSGTMDYSIQEILLYNMRDVQHHAAQLNLILRQTIDDAPVWVSRDSKKMS